METDKHTEERGQGLDDHVCMKAIQVCLVVGAGFLVRDRSHVI